MNDYTNIFYWSEILKFYTKLKWFLSALFLLPPAAASFPPRTPPGHLQGLPGICSTPYENHRFGQFNISKKGIILVYLDETLSKLHLSYCLCHVYHEKQLHEMPLPGITTFQFREFYLWTQGKSFCQL